MRAPGDAACRARAPRAARPCLLLPGGRQRLAGHRLAQGSALPSCSEPEHGRRSASKPFPDDPSPEGCFWLSRHSRKGGASGFNLSPRGSCHHGFAVRVKDAFTQPHARAEDMKTSGYSKIPMSRATPGPGLRTSAQRAGEGAIAPAPSFMG